MRARLKKEDLIIITGDDGGYKSGRCAVCKALGWIETLKHEVWCPIQTREKYTHVTITETD